MQGYINRKKDTHVLIAALMRRFHHSKAYLKDSIKKKLSSLKVDGAVSDHPTMTDEDVEKLK